jgi:hypothetical protein
LAGDESFRRKSGTVSSPSSHRGGEAGGGDFWARANGATAKVASSDVSHGKGIRLSNAILHGEPAGLDRTEVYRKPIAGRTLRKGPDLRAI